MSSSHKIVVIGGGSGSTTILRSLLPLKHKSLTVITTATDSGGRSGWVRTDERDHVISIGDLFNNLTALIAPDQLPLPHIQAFISLTNFTDGRRRNLGYTIYYGLLEKYQGNHQKTQSHIAQLLNINFQGQVVPVTTQVTSLCFETKLGNQYTGEAMLDYYQMSQDMVKKIWISPQVPANPDAIHAIKQANHIIFAPGSLYGSLLVNILPTGIQSALKKSAASKIILTNLVSDRNQTHHFTPLKYWQAFRKYTKHPKPFDIMIAPNIDTTSFNQQHPQIAQAYQAEHSHFLGWSDDQFQKIRDHNVTVITTDIATITHDLNRIRHDPKKLSSLWSKLIL